MEISTATSSTLNSVPDDRLTLSCPPEPWAGSAEDGLINEGSSSSTPQQNGIGMTSDGNSGTVLNDESVPFSRQIPEKPGETESYRNGHSCECSTLVEDDDEERQSEVVSASLDADVEADKFGFFINGRSQNGNPTVSTPIEIDVKTLRRREKKWLQMFENWRYFMDHKFDKVRDRCRKGVPPSIRGKAWKYLCGAVYHMEVSINKHVFDRCVRGDVDPKWADDIDKDLNRQFPEHEMFARNGKFGRNGREDLATLLRAWTVLYPEEGYCQGQAPIASVLLMHMPVKDAFYCFVQICMRYLPNYYSAGLEAVQIDGDILVQLLKEKCYVTYRHLKKNSVDPVLYMIEWFMCAYCRTLPWPTVLRVWDMFFCEGVKVLFKVALVLFKYGLGTKQQCKEYPDLHSIVTRLKNLPPSIMAEDFLVEKVCEISLDDAEMEKMHFRAMKLRQMRIKQK